MSYQEIGTLLPFSLVHLTSSLGTAHHDIQARTPRHAAELVRKLAQEAMASHFYPSEVFNVPIYLVSCLVRTNLRGGRGLSTGLAERLVV